MSVELTEALWLDRHHEYSLAELATLSGLSPDDLRQLVDYEALIPADPGATEVIFSAECLVVARTACRLRDDFELDAGGLALTLRLLERIRGLEADLRALHAQLPCRHR